VLINDPPLLDDRSRLDPVTFEASTAWRDFSLSVRS
jgi:hypothetical protein